VGSAEDGKSGLHLVVPAVTLLVPLVLLMAGLLTSPVVPSPGPPAVPTPLGDSTSSELATALAEVNPPTDDAVALATAAVLEPTPLDTPVVVAATPIPTISLPRPTATPQVVWNGPRTFTFVVLGVDQREEEIPRTDTIMIGKVDLSLPRASLISVPRDLVVDIPGYGLDRINTAYVYGELYKEPGGGIGLLKRTIEKNFGVSVDHFGLVDFQCFRSTVDAVGGVTVNVPKAIEDRQYPTDDYGYKVVRFEVGPQLMDGERALEYARTRHADSDFQRMQRQQLIMAAVRDQVLRLRSLPAVPAIVGGCRNMRSDLGWRDYADLATSLRALNGMPVAFAAVDERMVVDTTLASGAAVLLPRWEPIRAMFASALGNQTTASGAVGSPLRALASPSPSPLVVSTPTASPSPAPLFAPDRVAGPPSLDVPDESEPLPVPAS